MVNRRGEGWKAIKVGAMGRLTRRGGLPDSQTVRVKAIRYTAVGGAVNAWAPPIGALAGAGDLPRPDAARSPVLVRNGLGA
jgi:hypothetical protein